MLGAGQASQFRFQELAREKARRQEEKEQLRKEPQNLVSQATSHPVPDSCFLDRIYLVGFAEVSIQFLRFLLDLFGWFRGGFRVSPMSFRLSAGQPRESEPMGEFSIGAGFHGTQTGWVSLFPLTQAGYPQSTLRETVQLKAFGAIGPNTLRSGSEWSER